MPRASCERRGKAPTLQASGKAVKQACRSVASLQYQIGTARTDLTNRASSLRCSSVDFSRAWEQIAFRHAACDFARQELHRGADGRDRAGRFPTKAWKKCAESGILLLHLGVEDGIIDVCLDL
jgi:hypothetical protein